MTVQIETHDSIPVLALANRIDVRSVPQLQQHMERLQRADSHSYVVNLRDVDALDSAAVVQLVKLLKHARSKHGDVALVRARNESANRILHLTKFDEVFHINDTLQGALEHLKRR